jgi:hypothetical protein
MKKTANDLHNLYSSPDFVRTANLAYMGEIKNVYKISVVKPTGRHQLGEKVK